MKRLAVLCCVFFLIAGTAFAQGEERPPRSVLKQGSLRQVGKLGTYCWSWMDETGSGGGKCVDYFRQVWPKPKDAGKGARARITIRYPDAPDDGTLRYWRRVDEDKQPIGEGTQLSYETSSRTVDGNTVWDLSFELPDYRGRFFLNGFFAWVGKGDASYTWRLVLN